MQKPVLHHLQDYFFPHPRNDHRPHLFSAVSLGVLAFAIIVAEGAFLVQTKFVFLRTDFLASVLPSALVDLTNEDRTALGMPAVTENALLDAAAQAAADDMAAKGYFSHNSPDGKTPWYWLDQAGYRYSYAGQNLAVDFTDSSNVESAWMNSPTHRENILKPQYTDVGFGTANGTFEGHETTFVVEYFATPAPKPAVAAVPEKTTKPSPAAKVPSSAEVLGTQAAPAPVSAPAPQNWLMKLLASPFTLLAGLLTLLLAVIAVSMSSSIFMRGKVQHPAVVLGGAFLMLLIGGALFGGALFTGSAKVVTADGQGAASAVLYAN